MQHVPNVGLSLPSAPRRSAALPVGQTFSHTPQPVHLAATV
jgi:hypothetical protein